MKEQGRVIVLRCVSPQLDGSWIQCQPGTGPPQYLQVGLDVTTMVPTGDVEWDGDTPAEVWVPETRLNYWRREHAIDADSRRVAGELDAG